MTCYQQVYLIANLIIITEANYYAMGSEYNAHITHVALYVSFRAGEHASLINMCEGLGWNIASLGKMHSNS